MSDRIPICENCSNYPGEYNFCPITGRCCRDSHLYETCPDFEQKGKQTIFQRITASPEVLAEKLVIQITFNGKSKVFSTITKEFYETEAEAIAATVAKLKNI